MLNCCRIIFIWWYWSPNVYFIRIVFSFFGLINNMCLGLLESSRLVASSTFPHFLRFLDPQDSQRFFPLFALPETTTVTRLPFFLYSFVSRLSTSPFSNLQCLVRSRGSSHYFFQLDFCFLAVRSVLWPELHRNELILIYDLKFSLEF